MSPITPQYLRIVCDTLELIRVRRFVSEMARHAGVPAEVENRIVLAVDEAVSNIIEHGHQPASSDWIDIEAEIEAGTFTLIIRDFCKPFDPRSAPALDLVKHVRTGSRRGLGIFLMQHIMDRIDYRSTESGNELRLTKQIGPLSA